MPDTPTTPEKTDRPSAFFEKPRDIVTDPTLTKDQKSEALNVMEQDARQMAAASDEGMAGGERNKLQDVLVAKDTLELSPISYAYDTVTKDLRARLKTEPHGDAHALLEHAISGLDAVMKSTILNPAASSGTYDGPSAGSPADIADEIAREKLDPGA